VAVPQQGKGGMAAVARGQKCASPFSHGRVLAGMRVDMVEENIPDMPS